MSRRRLTELGFLVPWLGVLLLTPPFVVMLQTWSRVAEFPLFVLYLFACWLALIVLGGVVGAKLARMEEEERLRDRELSRLEPAD